MREDDPKTFHEATHLNGDVDMYEVVKAIVEEHRRKAARRKKPDPDACGPRSSMLDDLKRTNPGSPQLVVSERAWPKFAVSNWRCSVAFLPLICTGVAARLPPSSLPSLSEDGFWSYDDYYC